MRSKEISSPEEQIKVIPVADKNGLYIIETPSSWEFGPGSKLRSMAELTEILSRPLEE